ncbi:hypothetical protein GGP41_007856, partial [Bipolaris sorokiniana]
IAIVKTTLNTSVSRYSIKLEELDKGTLGSVGLERFRVESVLLFHKGKGKRRDGLIAIVKTTLNTSISRLSIKLEELDKGTLGSVGLERFRVESVPLFHKGKGKRRDGLVGNREPCEPIAQVVVCTIVEVVVVIPIQALLVTLFVLLLSRQRDDASEKPRSTKKRDIIVKVGSFSCDTMAALLILII